MKKIITIIAVSALLLSCSSGPEKAAKNFTENMAKGKVEDAKKYATQSTGKLLDMAVSFGGSQIEPDFKFEFVKDSIVDNRAWVTYMDNGEKKDLELVKIDGKWLVNVESKK
ncbi:DUF4878 domain-containing protein [Zunongwangia pacifica]|uniref:DUF4878 domain-containing protein n=1 Tax=Zunongwangia pacifica TaxID=2911062 RepID=A0A9X1ZSP9_9FLAO|nr:DUF4878 domain-containing protein [Zunongwangia pacifica]MCL6217738.1 DUF4878 domain-containing protein [Zunongwangia pacifica]